MGKALLALARPEEAIPVLGGALRGPLDAGNLYANRTEIHALLARAYEAAGYADSAAVHEQWVSRAHVEDEADLADGVNVNTR